MGINDEILKKIIDIELEMFIAVNSRQESGCQKHPESFRLHRWVQFLPWSYEALLSYLNDLIRAKSEGQNLMTLKYARMENLIPNINRNPLIDKIVSIQHNWQSEMFSKYPYFMRGARPLSSTVKTSMMTSFETYLRGELETYSDKTLSLLFADIEYMIDKGINMAEETYKALVRASGIKSLEEAEKLKRKRMSSETQCKNFT